MYYDLLNIIETNDDLVVTVCPGCQQESTRPISVYRGVFHALSKLMDFRDPYTRGHEIRVAKIATEIAHRLGLDQQRLLGILIAAELHDIGKIGVPIEYLAKPGRLTKDEFNIIKHHPEIGYEIIREIEFPWNIDKAVLQHHERLDGTGYPHGLKDDEISYEAKIISVADVTEAIISHRPYRPGLGLDVAMDELTLGTGTKYDPEIVEVCKQIFRENPGFLST